MDDNQISGISSVPEQKFEPLQDQYRKQQHDLNNIFAGILGSLHVALMRDLDDKTRALMQNALDGMTHLRQFISFSTSVKSNDDIKSDAPDVDQDRHDLFFAAIEMTRMPMVVTDPNQHDNPIIFVNQAFLHMTGYEMSEMIGRNCRFLQGKDSDKETVKSIQDAIHDKTDIAVELKNYRKDGTMFWNALFISPIFDQDGKLLYFFGSQLDVTRRREAETALRRAQKMEAIGQLTGGIAHDFNNLLQVIIGNLQMAQRSRSNPEKLDKYHNLIDQAASRARNLTQQLLAFSRKQPLESRVANMNRIVGDLEEILRQTLGPNITLETDLSPQLWNTSIDSVQLEMALINILINARDAMEHGGTVYLETTNHNVSAQQTSSDDLAPGHYIRLVIRDTGAGIPPEVLAHVMEPFFTTKDVGKGTGLGLAQVYGFVKQSRGQMTIDSDVGSGTTICMLFPAAEGSVTETEDQNKKTAPEGKGETILVVEDNKEIQELALEILESEGYKVTTADNAKDALERMREATFDLIFTDVIMPGSMNGITLAKEARRLYQPIAVLITTGFAQDLHGHDQNQSHGSEFETIYKPYLPTELTKKIRSILNRRYDHKA